MALRSALSRGAGERHGRGLPDALRRRGPRDGELIVCLHGEPTWGYLYRNLIPRLAERYRVVTPDHMGFGKSETPQDRAYTLQTHVENLASLLAALDARDVTFVAQDWAARLPPSTRCDTRIA